MVSDVTNSSPQAPETAPPRATLRVLVADDSPSFRSILCSFLESLPGIELCGVASNGLDALEIAAQTAPDLVLMDLVMPRMGGCEATRHLKRGQRSPRVVLLSICGDDELSKGEVGNRLRGVLGLRATDDCDS
jgi:DNA-binding NarL/FixJ family response regulator